MYGLVPFGKGFYFPTKCKNNSLGKKKQLGSFLPLGKSYNFF
jgi:hypothetical protein